MKVVQSDNPYDNVMLKYKKTEEKSLHTFQALIDKIYDDAKFIHSKVIEENKMLKVERRQLIMDHIYKYEQIVQAYKEELSKTDRIDFRHLNLDEFMKQLNKFSLKKDLANLDFSKININKKDLKRLQKMVELYQPQQKGKKYDKFRHS